MSAPACQPGTSLSRQGSLRSKQQDLASSRTWGRQLSYHGQNTRHAAHSSFAVNHAFAEESADFQQAAREQKLQASRDGLKTVVALEADLLRQYPHGLPAAKLRQLRQQDARLGGLGFGAEESLGGKQFYHVHATSSTKPHAAWHFNLQ
eukprot:jgi/Botrbrau1/12276/Bobra.0323s0016.1